MTARSAAVWGRVRPARGGAPGDRGAGSVRGADGRREAMVALQFGRRPERLPYRLCRRLPGGRFGPVVSALLTAVMVGCPATAAAGGTLTIGITQFPSTFHPAIQLMAAKQYILAMALRPVTEYGHDWRLRCFLCTRLPTLENGLAQPVELADGRTGVAVTYELHPDATWGDGTPVTSADVVFTWETALREGTGFSAREEYARITHIDVVDAKTFTVHRDRLTYTYNAFAGALLPAHLEAGPAADPAEYRNRTLYDTRPAEPGLWYGPYRVIEVVSGSHVVLVPNPAWQGRAPAFDRIVVRVIENTAALRANLLSGTIDYVSGQVGFNTDEALAFERDEADRFQVSFVPSLIYEHVDFNLDSIYFRDRKVRRALMHAINREALVDALFGGRQRVAHSPVHPLAPGYDPEVPTYAYHPERAARLLDEAGWRPGPGGIRVNAEGARLSFPLMTTAGSRARELVQQVLQAQFRTVGVEARIRNEPARVFFGETVTHRTNPGLNMYAFLSTPEGVPVEMLRSDRIPSEANGFAGQNFPGYRSERMDALLDALELELDPDRRRAMWSELQRLYAGDLPAIPLYFRVEPYVIPVWLTGVRPTGHQVPATMWIEEWRIAE